MQFFQFMNPSVKPDTEKEMDTASLKSIRMISLIGLVFEVATAITFFISIRGKD